MCIVFFFRFILVFKPDSDALFVDDKIVFADTAHDPLWRSSLQKVLSKSNLEHRKILYVTLQSAGVK